VQWAKKVKFLFGVFATWFLKLRTNCQLTIGEKSNTIKIRKKTNGLARC
jgi:hypothetical protein